jgi:hypothetical protein
MPATLIMKTNQILFATLPPYGSLMVVEVEALVIVRE